MAFIKNYGINHKKLWHKFKTYGINHKKLWQFNIT